MKYLEDHKVLYASVLITQNTKNVDSTKNFVWIYFWVEFL